MRVAEENGASKPARLPKSARNVLHPRQVETLTKPGHYPDGGNLYLQVSQYGTKSWIFRYTADGKRRHMGLGSAVDVSLAEARDKARTARAQLRDEVDPLEERRLRKARRRDEAATRRTFIECAEVVMVQRKKRARWTDKHAGQWLATLKTYVYPAIGKQLVHEISVQDVEAILEPIWEEKRETASRVRGRIKMVLDYAIAKEYRPAPNPAAWENNLKSRMNEEQTRRPKPKHLAAMPFRDVPAFMAELREREAVSARALEFLILTAARTSEVIEAKWPEFDFEAAVWTVPGERMKNGMPHRVPLSQSAINALESLRKLGGDWVFPGLKPNQPLSNMAMLKLLKDRMGYPDLTVHGFRSAFRDWASEETSHPNRAAELALAHSQTNSTEAAYRRSDMLKRRTLMMDDWARYLESGDGKAAAVVSINSRTASGS